MKSFLKTLLAVVVGIFVAGVLATLCLTCSVVGMAALSADDAVQTEKHDVLVLNLNDALDETEPAMPFSFSLLDGLTMDRSLSLRTLLEAIRLGAADPNIEGIYLSTDGLMAAPASLKALRNALADFKATGKWIVAYNDSYGFGQYYLASVADSVFVNPYGSVTLNGMTSLIPYFKGTLDKLGIEMQIFRVGTFKSAVEPYMQEHMSEANRLQTLTYMQEIWDEYTADIAASRGLTADTLNAWADRAIGYDKVSDLPAGLVDGARYRSQMEPLVKRMAGQKEDKALHAVTAKQMASTATDKEQGDRIAVLYAVGDIVDSGSKGETAIVGGDVVRQLGKLAKDKKVKAVVLRVNSPGGSAFASEQIWRALMDLKAAGKTLVVSMGDYAASGGYYISAPADYIFAEPTTITGSIGVFGMIPNFGSVADRIGLSFEEVKTHEYGTLTTFRAATEAEKARIQHGVEATYATFLSRVSEGRGLTADSVHTIAQGRVWTGSHALSIGLVDELGGLSDAVRKAADLAGLTEGKYHTRNYPEAKDPIMALLEQDNAEDNVVIRLADQLLGTDRQLERALRRARSGTRVFALMEQQPIFE